MMELFSFNMELNLDWRSNLKLFNDVDQIFINSLIEYGQAHLFECWDEVGKCDQEKINFLGQLKNVNKSYPGGIEQYILNARKLLKDSSEGINPFQSYTPEIPEGYKLETNSSLFLEMEQVGMNEIKDTCFVLVAGGLGERLGYSGIKLSLPSDITTGQCFLELYINSILALQDRARISSSNSKLSIPLVIMTSGDTHTQTVNLLEINSYFGMTVEQVFVLQQDLVPALKNNHGHFVTSDKSKYQLLMKPHGHGDVHTLLYQSGLVLKWKEEGRKWIVLFQDTNALVFHAIPAALGVSLSNSLEVNSVSVARKPGESMGSICQLRHENGTKLVLNVEYNQLESLLKATVNPNGDTCDSSGFSPYPGNINVLLFSLDPYLETLTQTKGCIPEFVNPKYKNKEKTQFTSTRLECMMQDYPKLLSSNARVSFTQFDRWICYSAVKNNLIEGAKNQKESGFAVW